MSYLYQLQQPAGLTEGSPGTFYSIAGPSPTAAFSVTTQGAKTVLASFATGYNIPSLLVSGVTGRLYSSVELSSNPGQMFSVSSNPGKQLYPTQSILPVLTQNLPDGTLLGLGAASGGVFYLVKCDLNGTVTPIYQFPSDERPTETAIYASDGNYYGLSTVQDGSAYVFRVTPGGSLTKLLNFPSGTFIGYFAVPLLQARDGNLYGAIATAGANHTGIIYKLTLGGQYTLLYTFPKDNNSGPTSLIEAGDGNLYGATIGNLPGGGYTQLFRITTSGQYTLLHAMTNPGLDGACQCYLVQGSDGEIYGTAQGGGIGGGTIFALDAGLPKPAPRAQHFHPASGPVGQPVLIWGSNLLSASVQFNGIPAAVSNRGSNYVWATVPAGAATGPITVTTPGGTITTHASFTVQ